MFRSVIAHLTIAVLLACPLLCRAAPPTGHAKGCCSCCWHESGPAKHSPTAPSPPTQRSGCICMGALISIDCVAVMPTLDGSAPLFAVVTPNATSSATGLLHAFRVTVDDDAGRDLRIALGSLVV